MKTLSELRKCAGREVGVRRNVYPRFLASGKMTADEVRHEIECMEQIYQLLKQMEASNPTAELKLES